MRKRKRATGEEYTSTTGTTVPAKNIPVSIDCRCPLKCSDKINNERQNQLRRQFFAMSDWSLQTAYLSGQVKVSTVAKRYTKNENSRRQQSKCYYLPNDECRDVRVCKLFFCGVLSLSDGRIARATSHGVPHPDRRGRHEPHNKTPDADSKFVEEYIQKFKTYASHYSRRKNPNRTYLSPDLNITKMYEMYRCHCQEQNPSRKPVKLPIFRNIFNHKFNLSFHPPHQDTCKTCDALDAQISACTGDNAKHDLVMSLQLHQRKADAARDSMRVDCELCKTDSQLTTITFDLQKTLPTPVLTTGVCYHKRQLWTYNLGIHSMADDQGFMYMWNESLASRGSDEIASALLYHITENINTENLIVYTDMCGGQNRNFKIAMLWNYIVQRDEYSVTHPLITNFSCLVTPFCRMTKILDSSKKQALS